MLPSPFGRRAGVEGLAALIQIEPLARDESRRVGIHLSQHKEEFWITSRPSPNPLPEGEGNQTLISQVCYCLWEREVDKELHFNSSWSSRSPSGTGDADACRDQVWTSSSPHRRQTVFPDQPRNKQRPERFSTPDHP